MNIRKSGLFVIAPNYRQSQIFLFNMDWKDRYYRVALQPQDIQGCYLDTWEVWWLDCMWPCSTHEEVEHMEYMKRLAKSRGADLHRWWT
jgi:hypothetical protein